MEERGRDGEGGERASGGEGERESGGETERGRGVKTIKNSNNLTLSLFLPFLLCIVECLNCDH